MRSRRLTANNNMLVRSHVKERSLSSSSVLHRPTNLPEGMNAEEEVCHITFQQWIPQSSSTLTWKHTWITITRRPLAFQKWWSLCKGLYPSSTRPRWRVTTRPPLITKDRTATITNNSNLMRSAENLKTIVISHREILPLDTKRPSQIMREKN